MNEMENRLKASSSNSGSSNDEKTEVRAVDDKFEKRGTAEVEDEGMKRRVQIVLEKKTGKEILRDLGGGAYTQPRWYVLSHRASGF